jgi:AcrR family transcriptional regulator
MAALAGGQYDVPAGIAFPAPAVAAGLAGTSTGEQMQKEDGAAMAPRDRLFAAAAELFYKLGLQGVGVDAIVKKAGTTKMALYRHFDSKDALITAWIAQIVAQYAGVLDSLAQRYPDAPREQLLGFAQFIADDIARAGHRGCPLVNSIAELPDDAHPARQAIEQHKTAQLQRITQLCRLAELQQPELTAVHLSCLMAGAQVVAEEGTVEDIGDHMLQLVRNIVGGPAN